MSYKVKTITVSAKPLEGYGYTHEVKRETLETREELLRFIEKTMDSASEIHIKNTGYKHPASLQNGEAPNA